MRWRATRRTRWGVEMFEGRRCRMRYRGRKTLTTTTARVRGYTARVGMCIQGHCVRARWVRGWYVLWISWLQFFCSQLYIIQRTTRGGALCWATTRVRSRTGTWCYRITSWRSEVIRKIPFLGLQTRVAYLSRRTPLRGLREVKYAGVKLDIWSRKWRAIWVIRSSVTIGYRGNIDRVWTREIGYQDELTLWRTI